MHTAWTHGRKPGGTVARDKGIVVFDPPVIARSCSVNHMRTYWQGLLQ